MERVRWAWDTICGHATFAGSIGFYPTNHRRETRWAAYDVDAHDGDTESARKIAGQLFAVAVQHTQLFVVLCTSLLDWMRRCSAVGWRHPLPAPPSLTEHAETAAPEHGE